MAPNHSKMDTNSDNVTATTHKVLVTFSKPLKAKKQGNNLIFEPVSVEHDVTMQTDNESSDDESVNNGIAAVTIDKSKDTHRGAFTTNTPPKPSNLFPGPSTDELESTPTPEEPTDEEPPVPTRDAANIEPSPAPTEPTTPTNVEAPAPAPVPKETTPTTEEPTDEEPPVPTSDAANIEPSPEPTNVDAPAPAPAPKETTDALVERPTVEVTWKSTAPAPKELTNAVDEPTDVEGTPKKDDDAVMEDGSVLAEFHFERFSTTHDGSENDDGAVMEESHGETPSTTPDGSENEYDTEMDKNADQPESTKYATKPAEGSNERDGYLQKQSTVEYNRILEKKGPLDAYNYAKKMQHMCGILVDGFNPSAHPPKDDSNVDGKHDPMLNDNEDASKEQSMPGGDDVTNNTSDKNDGSDGGIFPNDKGEEDAGKEQSVLVIVVTKNSSDKNNDDDGGTFPDNDEDSGTFPNNDEEEDAGKGQPVLIIVASNDDSSDDGNNEMKRKLRSFNNKDRPDSSKKQKVVAEDAMDSYEDGDIDNSSDGGNKASDRIVELRKIKDGRTAYINNEAPHLPAKGGFLDDEEMEDAHKYMDDPKNWSIIDRVSKLNLLEDPHFTKEEQSKDVLPYVDSLISHMDGRGACKLTQYKSVEGLVKNALSIDKKKHKLPKAMKARLSDGEANMVVLLADFLSLKLMRKKKDKFAVLAYVLAMYGQRLDTYYLESWYPGPGRRGEPTLPGLYKSWDEFYAANA